ncbi:hypothetical protein AVL50_30365 [Flammeovirga sp. SJP92]|nr:hypothetical protein AVL50_30365 [Flammeovirga sp. SJP92]
MDQKKSNASKNTTLSSFLVQSQENCNTNSWIILRSLIAKKQRNIKLFNAFKNLDTEKGS